MKELRESEGHTHIGKEEPPNQMLSGFASTSRIPVLVQVSTESL